MSVLIDAYNCMHAGIIMGGAMSGLSIRGLCRWLSEWHATERREIVLVLDGRPKPEEPNNSEYPELEMLYSGAGIKADQIIEKKVAARKGRKNILVVTNDRAVAARTRGLGAKTQSCEEFLEMLIAARKAGAAKKRQALPEEKTGGVASSGETQQWLETFGFEEQKKQQRTTRRAEDIDLNAIDPEEFM